MPALSFNQHKSESGQGTLSGENQEFSVYDLAESVVIPGEPMEYHSVQLIRDEFLMNLQKFENNIQRTIQQLEGLFCPPRPSPKPCSKN
jgi:dynein heavy chain